MQLGRFFLDYFAFRAKALPVARLIDNGHVASGKAAPGIVALLGARVRSGDDAPARVEGRLVEAISG